MAQARKTIVRGRWEVVGLTATIGGLAVTSLIWVQSQAPANLTLVWGVAVSVLLAVVIALCVILPFTLVPPPASRLEHAQNLHVEAVDRVNGLTAALKDAGIRETDSEANTLLALSTGATDRADYWREDAAAARKEQKVLKWQVEAAEADEREATVLLNRRLPRKQRSRL